MENNYGWICPKCGCPNAPTNETCVACFNHEKIEISEPVPLFKQRCPKCGMDLSKPLGFVCPDFCCPQRSGITAFNPLNAADNFNPISPLSFRTLDSLMELRNQHSCTNIREEED